MESIFERDFYPTPQEVIEQMLQGHDVSGKIILEPSAGSGNIVGYLQDSLAREVIACEKNEKLRRIVEGKCRVIADDFLTVTSEMVSHIDMIVMNPPFSDARRHILHAFEIAPGGCEIISLCNSSDLRQGWNKTEDQEKVIELVENHGFDEYLGECFTSAERKTDVSVSCIHLFKPKSGDQEFEDYMFSTQEEVDTGNTEGLIEYNLVRDVVNRYCEAVKRFDHVMEASKELNELTGMFRGEYGGGILFGAYRDNKSFQSRITRQQFKNDLQKRAWRYIIEKMDLDRFATSKVYEQINSFVERQSHVPFTMKNVYQMIYLIIGTQGNRMETAIIDAFDQICSFSAENSTAGEKWKTNANYMVNRKFIVPYIFAGESYGYKYPHLNLTYSSGRNSLADVCKALEYISGKSELQSMFDYIRGRNLEWGKWHTYGGFFRFKGFKKGTMHLEFLDEDLWMLFNRRVAEIKGWQLPKKTGKREAV